MHDDSKKKDGNEREKNHRKIFVETTESEEELSWEGHIECELTLANKA